MNLKLLVAVLLGTLAYTLAQTASPISETLAKEDLDRFEALAEKTLSQASSNDLSSVFYAASILKTLGKTSKSAKPACDFVKSKVASSASQLQNVYYIAGVNKALACGVAKKDLEKTLKLAEDEKAKMQDRFFGVQAAVDLESTSSLNTASLLKSLSAQLTSASADVPLASQVYGVHMASNLAGKTASPEVTSLFDLVEDIVGQADEVNEKYLQLEGGLGVTALFLEAAFNLGAKLNKAPLIQAGKLQQFTNYVMSRKDSQSVKSLYFVLTAANTLSNNKYMVPVCVTLKSGKTLSPSQGGKVQIKVSNLMGAPVTSAGTVTAEQVSGNADGVIIVNKEALKATATDKSVYELDLLKLKPRAGFFTIAVSVAAGSATATPKLVGVSPGMATLGLKVTSEVSVVNMNIAVIDSESSSTMGKQNPVAYPGALKTALSADSTQKVVATFGLKDKLSNQDFEPHQVFMRLVHVASQLEAFFVCEKSGAQYEFEVKLKDSEGVLKSLSGDYEMHLIVGDAVITNSFMWLLGKVNFAFADGKTEYSEPAYMAEYKPRSEIHHVFRQPDPRPAVVFSQVFAVLAALPLLVLLLLWSKMGVNVSNMQMDLPTLIFHGGLAAIFGLYYCYWAHLNMFQTLKYLSFLAVITFLAGHKLLKKLALARVNNSTAIGG